MGRRSNCGSHDDGVLWVWACWPKGWVSAKRVLRVIHASFELLRVQKRLTLCEIRKDANARFEASDAITPLRSDENQNRRWKESASASNTGVVVTSNTAEFKMRADRDLYWETMSMFRAVSAA